MVSIDTVYQRVLAILNKENRGYMTPQEFNLLANQAQLEVFEQYFYDLSQFNRLGEINSEYANIIDNIKEKISLFKKTSSLTISGSAFPLPDDLYRLGTVYYNNTTPLDQLDQNEFLYINASPLAKPSTTQPAFVRNGNNLSIYPSTITSNIDLSYIKVPTEVKWGYVTISDVAQYDSSTAVDFELHESDETTLVYKILSYAGLVIKQPEVSQVAEQKDAIKTQKEKS